MDRNNTIKEMYREERPYEKCEQYGAENLTDAELLAVLLRTGTKGENSLQLAKRLQIDGIPLQGCFWNTFMHHLHHQPKYNTVPFVCELFLLFNLCISPTEKTGAQLPSTFVISWRNDHKTPFLPARWYLRSDCHPDEVPVTASDSSAASHL